MMRQQAGLQEQLFYEFRLDDWVPVDHLLRKIDAVLDLSGLRRELAPFYSHTGRPSVDPELMIRVLLVGYCYGIRSERRLCQEVHLNLAYRWFCRLGLEGVVPEHSSFSKNRHGRFRDSALFRRLFEDVVLRCVKAGLVGGERFAIDASVIEADASRGRKVDGKITTWPEAEKITRPVREYLSALDQAAAEAAASDAENDDMPSGNPPAAPKVTSLTDPAAAWTNKGQVKVGFAYGTNYLIDTRQAIILDVEPTPARWTADRGTWLSFGNKGDLAVLVEGDPRLLNRYDVMLLNPAKHPVPKQALAGRFAKWLLSPEGQEAIGAYKVDGEQLFHPSAAAPK